ncbi:MULTISPECIES: amino acid ABC transporter substrate-binding protein/permease [Bifidobacterium]|uniref:amino acid ABC transporter substrate-binding protein/permease n=1 Tax=Bifidobacterium TaxID=1678 RepID=UPI00028A8529|nr:amino acid ABC transporter substrate-binding protein/permease [Bifidobacterium asteroides]AFU71247.1 ABC transporter, extracellular substrate binding/permease protein [Bifidobacterium asteroides PRL2011]
MIATHVRQRWTSGPGRWAVGLLALVLGLSALIAAPLATPAQAAQDSPAAQAVNGRTFRVATDTTFAPFEFRDSSGNLVGIDMDLIRKIADIEGFSVQIQSLGFNAALQALNSQQADVVIAGMTITDQRKQVYDFTDPYFDSGVQMAIAKDNDQIHSYKDLRGSVVAVKTGSEGEAFAKQRADQYGFTVKAVDQSSTMYEMVKSGNAQAVIDDYPVLAYGIAQGNGLKTVTKKEPGASYGAAVRKGENKEFVAAFNEGLAKMKADGSYKKLVDSYVGGSHSSKSASASRPGFFELVRQAFPSLMLGLRNTLAITAISFVIALAIGIILGLWRISPNRILSWIARIYVAVFRGTPVLVWAFFFYLGVPQLIGHRISIWLAGALTLSLNSGAYLVEIVRGAIDSVDVGQMEGARSLGLTRRMALRRVILPQAVRIASPSIINQLVIMLKDSSLLLAIGFGELLYQAQQIYAANFRVTETLFMVGVIYFVAISALTWMANMLDRRLHR